MANPPLQKCDICGEPQDTQNYEGKNICTICYDVMEDIMADYFLKVIESGNRNRPEHLYVKYIESNIKFMSDKSRIMEKVPQHLKTTEKRLLFNLSYENLTSRKRFYEYALKVLEWLKNNQWFYKYYFKNIYRCPKCGASLFDNYVKETKGEWVIISCAVCNNVVRKYYKPEIL
jgi:formylmethanofuran dehydrogenase subunit E